MAAKLLCLVLAVSPAFFEAALLRAHNTTKDSNTTTVVKTCKVDGVGINADVTTSPSSFPSGGSWNFTMAGVVRVKHEACPSDVSTYEEFWANGATKYVSGGASNSKAFGCAGECCVAFCCGTEECFSSR
jgi:hypothetical protein